MLDLKAIREEFPILAREVHNRPLVYLDSGATAQKPLCVIDEIDRLHSELNANIHRGVHFLSEQTTDLYEQARERVRAFIGAASRTEIVFTAGATASINLVAQAWSEEFLHEGDNIVVSEMEHHSNIVPWQLAAERVGAQLRVLPFDDRGEVCYEKLGELLDEHTKLVAITQASNTLGTRPDLKAMIALAHRHGAKVTVDGCQGVVHGGVDVLDLDCDFYAFSGHKLYAPTGIGVLYGKRELLEMTRKTIVHNSIIDAGDDMNAYQTSDFSERIEERQMLGLANMMNRKLQITPGLDTKYAVNGCDISDTNCNIYTINIDNT